MRWRAAPSSSGTGISGGNTLGSCAVLIRLLLCSEPVGSPFCPQEATALAFPAAFLLRLTLIVELLAASKRKLDLRAPTLVKIEPQRHQRHALALNRPNKLVNLPAVQEKLAQAFWRMIEAAGLHIFRDICVDEP